eukprot:108573-Prymnesium_polylepis.1
MGHLGLDFHGFGSRGDEMATLTHVLSHREKPQTREASEEPPKIRKLYGVRMHVSPPGKARTVPGGG